LWLKKDYDHAASYGYSLECEAKDVGVLKPKDGQQWQAIAKDCILW